LEPSLYNFVFLTESGYQRPSLKLCTNIKTSVDKIAPINTPKVSKRKRAHVKGFKSLTEIRKHNYATTNEFSFI
jgi:hypothetical protein